MNKLCLAVCLLLLAGCAGVAGNPSPIIEADGADQVKDCRLMKTFSAPAGYRMWGTPYLGNFKYEVIKEAEKMGATHILFRSEADGIDSTAVINVYKCPPDHETFQEEQKMEEEEY